MHEIFKAYDIRGIYPGEFDEEAAFAIGAAFAVFAASDAVLVGRDMRVSSPELASAFMDGLNAAGADAIDLGLVSTDLVYFASGRHQLPGAMFTASHNPAQYNGIKLCLSGAAPVGEDTGLRDILALTAQPTLATIQGKRRSLDLLEEFAEHLLSSVDRLSIRGLTVVADAANGMGGAVIPAVLGQLDIDLVGLFFELDGTFPNHPADPIQPENLKTLCAEVLTSRADLGLAFDGDADRVFLVDEKAHGVSGSLTTALVAQKMLEKNPGSTVIYNVICSRSVPEVIAESGGTPHRCRVGHSFIKADMATTGAVFAGEHSGHYYFRDNFRADSGLLASLHVLEAISKSGKTLSELIAPLDRYSASGEINTPVKDAAAVIEAVASSFGGTQDRLDGLTVSYKDWWFNVRPSNTEPLLRLNLEARDHEMMTSKTHDVLEMIRR